MLGANMLQGLKSWFLSVMLLLAPTSMGKDDRGVVAGIIAALVIIILILIIFLLVEILV